MKEHHPTIEMASPVDPSWRIGIIHSSFYKEGVSHLVKGAQEMLEHAGIHSKNIRHYEVFGAFEIPLIGAELAARKDIDALIALGIVVQGETSHAQLVTQSSAQAIMDVQVKYQIPFAFEILAVDTLDLALRRLDRGAEAARAVLHSLALLKRIRS